MKTTLFMLISLDGKISTGSIYERDFDKDLPNISGAKEGLQQYYKLEKKTDYHSFNTGKVFAKVGWNEPHNERRTIPAKFVIIDNKPHITKTGVQNLLRRSKGLILITTNPRHPALGIEDSKLHIIQYSNNTDFKDLFAKLENDYGVKKMTIQSGGDMNAVLLREGLINEVSIVIAPILVGGKQTVGLIGGESNTSIDELNNIRTLKMINITKLEHDYLHVRYSVQNT